MPGGALQHADALKRWSIFIRWIKRASVLMRESVDPSLHVSSKWTQGSSTGISSTSSERIWLA